MFSERPKPTNLETTEVKLPEEMQNLIKELQNSNKLLFVIVDDITDENSKRASLTISFNTGIVRKIREGVITTMAEFDDLRTEFQNTLPKETSQFENDLEIKRLDIDKKVIPNFRF